MKQKDLNKTLTCKACSGIGKVQYNTKKERDEKVYELYQQGLTHHIIWSAYGIKKTTFYSIIKELDNKD